MTSYRRERKEWQRARTAPRQPSQRASGGKLRRGADERPDVLPTRTRRPERLPNLRSLCEGDSTARDELQANGGRQFCQVNSVSQHSARAGLKSRQHSPRSSRLRARLFDRPQLMAQCRMGRYEQPWKEQTSPAEGSRKRSVACLATGRLLIEACASVHSCQLVRWGVGVMDACVGSLLWSEKHHRGQKRRGSEVLLLRSHQEVGGASRRARARRRRRRMLGVV